MNNVQKTLVELYSKVTQDANVPYYVQFTLWHLLLDIDEQISEVPIKEPVPTYCGMESNMRMYGKHVRVHSQANGHSGQDVVVEVLNGCGQWKEKACYTANNTEYPYTSAHVCAQRWQDEFELKYGKGE